MKPPEGEVTVVFAFAEVPPELLAFVDGRVALVLDQARAKGVRVSELIEDLARCCYLQGMRDGATLEAGDLITQPRYENN